VSPLDFDIAWDDSVGIARVRVTGVYDLESVDRVSEALLDLPGFTPGTGVLYDVRGIDPGNVDAQQMRMLGKRNEARADRRGSGKMAVLVSNDVTFGLARMYSVLGVPPNVDMRPFRDSSEAEAWLTAPSGESG